MNAHMILGTVARTSGKTPSKILKITPKSFYGKPVTKHSFPKNLRVNYYDTYNGKVASLDIRDDLLKIHNLISDENLWIELKKYKSTSNTFISNFKLNEKIKKMNLTDTELDCALMHVKLIAENGWSSFVLKQSKKYTKEL